MTEPPSYLPIWIRGLAQGPVSSHHITAHRRTPHHSGTGLYMVDHVSVPILMIHQAIMSLQEVIDTAEKIDTENRKQQILLFLLALLSLIPIGGEVIAAINGLAGVGRFIALADEARIVGMDGSLFCC